MIKKSFIVVFLIFTFFVVPNSFAQETYTLKTGVSLTAKVPKTLYGTWRVKSKLVSTNNYSTFKPQSVDLWNLSRTGDVINLENPYTGANATITVKFAEGEIVHFTKTGTYEKQRLTDTVSIRIVGDSFKGYNDLKLETLSSLDRHVMKVEYAKYALTGERIAGGNIK